MIMAQGDMYYPMKLDNLHSSFTNNYLLKHGNMFTKPELPSGNRYSFSFFAANVEGYNSGDNVREIVKDRSVPLNFAIKHEKPPTPPTSTSPITTKTPPLLNLEENSKNLCLQFPIDESKNSTWILGKQKLSWDNSTVASYNPETKMFRCVVCNAVGFLSRIAEHYLGTHTSAKVFQCLHCPYSSTWSRCVRMHMAKHHSVPNAPPSLWKGQPLLEEIFQLLTNLKTAVDNQGRDKIDSELSDKKFLCPKCPYTTDRRDLYLRHENIHKEDKPYHCYVCFKLFNRADHVKKHFLRIHRGHPYDISLVRRRPPRNTPSYPASAKNITAEIKPCPNDNKYLSKPFSTDIYDSLEKNIKNDINIIPINLDPISSVPLPTSYECPYCSWEGVDTWCLRRHMNIHVKIFECPICEYKSNKAERLFTHVYKAHMMLICTKCKFVSDQAQRFENHIKDCCVEMVIGQKKNLENMSSAEKKNLDSVLVARDVNLPPITSTSEYFSSYLAHSQNFSTNLKDGKGSLSIIPLHNSVSYCFPTQPPTADEFCDIIIGDTKSPINSSDSIRKTVKFPIVPESKVEVKTEPELLLQSSSDSKKHDSGNNLDLICWECGCEFANESSLQIHLELYHQALQSAKVYETTSSNKKRFSCSLCNFSSNEQRTILDHMRYHTGETLRCKAGAQCNFVTIFDATLREHVQDTHLDGRKRCPHCGLLSEERVAFIRHYRRCHHSTSCHSCRDLRRSFTNQEGESAISSSSSSSSSCAEIRPYLHHNPYSKTNNAIAPYNSRNLAMAKVAVSIPPPLEQLFENNSTKTTKNFINGKKSRKQSYPRKLVLYSMAISNNEESLIESNVSRCDNTLAKISVKELLYRYQDKFFKENRGPIRYCKSCYKKPLYFKNHANYVLHHVWYHFPKKRKCKNCKAVFKYEYQRMMHKRKVHTNVLNKI